MQLISGDPAAARITLAHAERVLPMSSADMFDGSQIRHEYSVALMLRGHRARGRRRQGARHETARAISTACSIDYEENGGKHFGLYRLRAESLAMQGKMDEAQAAMNTAWKNGWRNVWRARREPYFAGRSSTSEAVED